MKRIYVNFKRFDVPDGLGGVNGLFPPQDWAREMLRDTRAAVEALAAHGAACTFFFPEAHVLPAIAARGAQALPRIGCQGVYFEDIAAGGNFGAFTAARPAAAAKALGCESVLIGHCEERRGYLRVLAEAGIRGAEAARAVNRLLAREAECAARRGLQILYCIGEQAEERESWRSVLEAQLEAGLATAQGGELAIAYEPVWAIGPGKQPPDAATIAEATRFIKERAGDCAVVYGGGLKADNAAMLAAIPEIDGGLIALTRFSGKIGFYPEEFLEIIRLYFGE